MTERKMWIGVYLFYLCTLPVVGVLALFMFQTSDPVSMFIGAGMTIISLLTCVALPQVIYQDRVIIQQVSKLTASMLPVFDELPRSVWEKYPRGRYVYIVQDADITRCCKIGRTNWPARRLNDFGVQLPFRMRVVCIIRCSDMVALEGFLHKRYAHKRHGGEWFALDTKDIRDIRRIAGS